jgi:hypothetical protein
VGGAIRQEGDRDGGDDDSGSDVRAGRRDQPELSLLEDRRSIVEEQPKERFEQCSAPPETGLWAVRDCTARPTDGDKAAFSEIRLTLTDSESVLGKDAD